MNFTKLVNVGVPPKVPERKPPLVALNWPDTVEEPVMASEEVVPEPREKLLPVMRPVFEIENRVDVELFEVVDPIANKVVSTELDAAWRESCANGVEVPIPTLPLTEKVVLAMTEVEEA